MATPQAVRRHFDTAERVAAGLYARQLDLITRIEAQGITGDVLRRNAELELRLFRTQRELEAVLTAYAVAGRIPARWIAQILGSSRRRLSTPAEEDVA